MAQTPHLLCLWLERRLIAEIEYSPAEEAWSLCYADDWRSDPDAFPLSPALPLERKIPSGAVRRFLEKPATALREITIAELEQRIANRDQCALIEWDGKMRMSVAGYQDKLPVYSSGQPADGARMFLPDFPLASTHILKLQPAEAGLPHMVANEHFCMTLAQTIGMPVAEVAILRTPTPVLVATRFDRAVLAGMTVQRKHIIDACQASDLPVSYKYERNIGDALYRDGVSLPVLFNILQDRTAVLRWALFQLVIGNSDAHGKNFSFVVHRSGLQAAPWYDLMSVAQYPQFSHELAMAFGDEFSLDQVKAFALADFSQRCGIDRHLLLREAKRLRDGVRQHAAALVESGPYLDAEPAFQDTRSLLAHRFLHDGACVSYGKMVGE